MKIKEEKGERGRIVVCDFGGARMREFMRGRENMFFKLYIYIKWVGGQIISTFLESYFAVFQRIFSLLSLFDMLKFILRLIVTNKGKKELRIN